METNINKIAVIMLAGNQQNMCFWPSYYNTIPGVSHDLIIVHRNMLGVPESIMVKPENLLFLNKIINGVDVPHQAFGGYRFAFETYKDNYDYFIFISDDVILKRDNWLLKIINTMELNDKLGFGGSQIFNGGTNYPHESHVRAPFWFAKTKALKSIDWEFNSDHDGEMKIGDQLTNAGYFGVQIGNKIDLGYDAREENHISQLLEKKYSPNTHPIKKIIEYDFFNGKEEFLTEYIISPFSHIGSQNVFKDIQPFDGLIYLPSLDIAKKSNIQINNKGYNIYTI